MTKAEAFLLRNFHLVFLFVLTIPREVTYSEHMSPREIKSGRKQESSIKIHKYFIDRQNACIGIIVPEVLTINHHIFGRPNSWLLFAGVDQAKSRTTTG